MRIFITGGFGFIGEALQEQIRHYEKFEDEKGVHHKPLHDIFIYDIIRGADIRDMAYLDQCIERFKPEVIIHLAALAGVRRGEVYPDKYFSTNVAGTYNVFAIAKKYGIKKVITFSSSCVFNDKGELKPESVYGQSKLFSEKIAEQFSAFIPNVYVVRPFTVYGENGRGDQVIGAWMREIKNGQPITFFGEGTSFRPYTYVGDVVEAVEKLLEKDLGYQTFNLGGIENVYLYDLLHYFQMFYGEKNVVIKVNKVPKPEQDSEGRIPPDTENWNLIPYDPPQGRFRPRLVEILKKESGF